MDFVKNKETNWAKLKEELIDDLKQLFRPEFLNRLDDIIIFKSLDRKQIKEIVKILLDDVIKLMKAQRIKIRFDDDVIDYLANIGYEPEFGARPMRRVIQKEIENKLANDILAGKFKEGDTVSVQLKNKQIILTKLT